MPPPRSGPSVPCALMGDLWGPPDPRTRVVGPGHGPIPQRRRTRTVPRAIGGAVASALVPGSGQVLQRRWRAAALFGLPTIVVVLGAAWALRHDRTTLVSWSVDADVLRSAGLFGVLWAIWCAVAAADAVQSGWPGARRSRASHVAGSVALVVVTVAATLPGLAGAWVALRQDRVLETVFASAEDGVVALPSPLADLGITTTTPQTRAAPPSAASTLAPTTRPATVPTTARPRRPRRRSRCLRPAAGTSPSWAATPGRTAGGCGPTP